LTPSVCAASGARSIRIDEAGWKRFRLEHSDRTPGNPLRLRYRIQGGKRRAIPAMAFCRNGGCPTELLTAGDDIVATSVHDPLVLHGNWAGQDGTLPAPSELNALRWRQVGGAPAERITSDASCLRAARRISSMSSIVA
jgi:hypothetical protein